MSQVAVWAALMCCLHSSPSSNPGRWHVVLRTYDTFGVPPQEMERARLVVDDLLKRASVQAEWRTCAARGSFEDEEQPLCGVLASNELTVRIVAATSSTSPAALGSAQLAPGGGVLATVYADRICLIADRLRVDAGRLLGRVIAHEVGHLLLGAPVHSPGGLMRARWSASEVMDERAFDWGWSAQEIVKIDRALEGRAPEFEQAVSALATARTTPVTTTTPTCRAGAKCPRR